MNYLGSPVDLAAAPSPPPLALATSAHLCRRSLRRAFVVAAALVVAGALEGPTAAQPAAAPAAAARVKPNIVLIVADDLGHGDVAAYGADIATPRIDSIAQGGVRFTDGYVTAPVCNPSRAGLMTGRYQQRWGQEENDQEVPPDGAPSASLPQAERTLGAAMKAAGYSTGAIGKWHLGVQPGYHPMDRGFDEFFGMASGTRYIDKSWPGVRYFEGLGAFDRSAPGGDGESEDPARLARRGLWDGREPAKLEEYLTDQLAREAVEFIDRHRSEPFFLYLAFYAPHAPLETTDEYYQRFPQFENERKRIHAAMISALDDGVGSVLDKLAEIGAAENTIVVFVSDNGGPEVTDAAGRCNAPLLGHKRNLYEGGIRLPFMMRWPARLQAGATYSEMVSTLDLFPTLLAAAGAPADGGAASAAASGEARALDGVDLLPFLTGQRQGAPHQALYWRSGPNGAIRQGPYKLILAGDLVRLYDLDADAKESRDLSALEPAKVDQLRSAWKAWNAQLSPARTSRRTEVTHHNGDAIRWHI
jgi:arylsulfatase A-like enzyme